MAIRSSSLGGIPFGDNAGRPASPQVGQPYFNGQENRLEIYSQSVGWQNIVAETPGIVSVQGTITDTNSVNNLTISGTNFFSGAIASIIGTNGVEIQANSTVVNSIVSITSVFGAISPLYEPYDVKVTNVSNLYGLLTDALYVNDTPTWVTASGNLSTVYEGDSINAQVTAFDDNEGIPLTYEISSGSLPSGVTLNSSTGAITGTAPNVNSNTTYTFSITATDGVNTSSARSFNIVVNNIAVEALVVGGGGGGGYDRGSGGGAGGMIDHPSYNINRNTSYTVTVGNGGSGGTSNNQNINGQNSVFDSLTALGGGGGNMTGAGFNGGSGGGGGWGGSAAGSGLQPSQTGASGTYGYGNAGGAGGSNVIGGGGGAGAAGSSSSPTNSSNRPNGGIGRQSSITGTPTYYAGGGGGGEAFDGSPKYYVQGFGGTGGGGNGGNTNGGSGFAGTPNTGGGGGGGANIPQGVGAAGGSGVVIIAYPTALPALTISAGLTYDQPSRSGYRVYRFTAGTGTVTL